MLLSSDSFFCSLSGLRAWTYSGRDRISCILSRTAASSGGAFSARACQAARNSKQRVMSRAVILRLTPGVLHGLPSETIQGSLRASQGADRALAVPRVPPALVLAGAVVPR